MNHLWRAWSTRSAADDLWATEISLRGKGESRPLKDWRLMTAATFEQRLFPLACARPPRRVGDEAIVFAERPGNTARESRAFLRPIALNICDGGDLTDEGSGAGAKMVRRAILVIVLLLVAVPAAHPDVTQAASSRDFYVSPDGSDASPGTSPSAPWRTLARVNSAFLLPGDRVHLRGNATFREPLAPRAGTNGTTAQPIVFDSYGTGRATLTAGIYLNSVSNLDFETLNVTSTGKGIFSSAGGTGVGTILLRDLTISDVPLAGISSNNLADRAWRIEGVRISRT